MPPAKRKVPDQQSSDKPASQRARGPEKKGPGGRAKKSPLPAEANERHLELFKLNERFMTKSPPPERETHNNKGDEDPFLKNPISEYLLPPLPKGSQEDRYDMLKRKY